MAKLSVQDTHITVISFNLNKRLNDRKNFSVCNITKKILINSKKNIIFTELEH